MSVPRHPCPQCRRETRREGACPQCHALTKAKPTEDDALPAGQWVLRGAIRVFVPHGDFDRNAADLIIARRGPRKPPVCGTRGGYSRHLAQGETTCTDCRAFMARRKVALRAAKGEAHLKPHGTHAAYNRHKKRGETVCDMCAMGETQYQRQRSQTRRDADQTQEKEAA